MANFWKSDACILKLKKKSRIEFTFSWHLGSFGTDNVTLVVFFWVLEINMGSVRTHRPRDLYEIPGDFPHNRDKLIFNWHFLRVFYPMYLFTRSFAAAPALPNRASTILPNHHSKFLILLTLLPHKCMPMVNMIVLDLHQLITQQSLITHSQSQK